MRDVLRPNRFNKLKVIIEKVCEDIYNKRKSINIFSSKFLFKKNLPCLYSILGKERTRKLMLEWVNEETVFEYIGEGIKEDAQTGKELYKPLNKNEKNKIDALVNKKNNLSEDEKKIKHIYFNTYNNDNIFVDSSI